MKKEAETSTTSSVTWGELSLIRHDRSHKFFFTEAKLNKARSITQILLTNGKCRKGFSFYITCREFARVRHVLTIAYETPLLTIALKRTLRIVEGKD